MNGGNSRDHSENGGRPLLANLPYGTVRAVEKPVWVRVADEMQKDVTSAVLRREQILRGIQSEDEPLYMEGMPGRDSRGRKY